MADQLENFFRENRDAFNDAEPKDGHEDRFRSALESSPKKDPRGELGFRGGNGA